LNGKLHETEVAIVFCSLTSGTNVGGAYHVHRELIGWLWFAIGRYHHL